MESIDLLFMLEVCDKGGIYIFSKELQEAKQPSFKHNELS